MHANGLHYLPLSPGLFSILAGIFILLVVLLRVGALPYAYTRIGISAQGAILILLASLVGSYFNIPLAELPGQHILSGREIDFFGLHYMVPVVVDWPGTIVAVNVGGALIPGLISLYVLVRHRLWMRGALAIAGVSAICHFLAKPVPGLGIALPIFVPAIASALMAMVLSLRRTAALAYIGGSLGALVGADLLNLGRVQGLGAPVVSIGGAGTFDGVFLTGILAVLLAGLWSPHSQNRAEFYSEQSRNA
ncbi:MAG: DUF1614 domain-containing protein [Verrucomicrobia bacterium]|nr:DUF1614 domain-containing protein [Verrucomicrobiota bacterium]MBV9274444.1 DUF1614 domain-containing protein [Verrucomicrobiota bacterium]